MDPILGAWIYTCSRSVTGTDFEEWACLEPDEPFCKMARARKWESGVFLRGRAYIKAGGRGDDDRLGGDGPGAQVEGRIGREG